MSKKKKITEYVVPRTPAQEAFAAKILGLRKKVKEAKANRDSALDNCVHSIAYSIDTSWPGNPEGHCWCDICEMHFGHYCPESPDHGCHYNTEDGLHVKLFTGEIVRKPMNEIKPEYDIITVEQDCRAWETDDQCIFCGAPNERK